MSAPRPVLNRRVRISKTGRPYVNVADLVKSELERLKKSEQATQEKPSVADSSNGNESGADNKHCEQT